MSEQPLKHKVNYINNYIKQICNDKVLYSSDKQYFNCRQLLIIQKFIKNLEGVLWLKIFKKQLSFRPPVCGL